MLQTYLPISRGMAGCQVVTLLFYCLSQLGIRNGRHAVDCIHTRLVECNRIEGSKEAYVRDDCQIVFAVTITVGGDLDDDAYVKTRSVMADGVCVLGDLAIELVITAVVVVGNGIGGTDGNAATASDTLGLIDPGKSVCDMRGVVGADVDAVAAPDAQALVDLRLAVTVHLHFTGTRTSSHANVLQHPSEPC